MLEASAVINDDKWFFGVLTVTPKIIDEYYFFPIFCSTTWCRSFEKESIRAASFGFLLGIMGIEPADAISSSK